VVLEVNVSEGPDLARCPKEHPKSMIGEEFFDFLTIMSVLCILMIIIR